MFNVVVIYIISFCCKQGTPTNDELEELSFKIAQKWKKLGRRLNVEEPKLQELHQLPDQLKRFSHVTALELLRLCS